MKLKVKVAAGCLIACGWLSAAPPACGTGTLADYLGLGAQGCTLNGDVFANFSYSASAGGGGATITADQVIVTPLVAVPATVRFNFSAPWSVDRDQTQESVIRYTIVPTPGGTAPSQLQLTLGTPQVGGIIGGVRVIESTNVGHLGAFVRCTEFCQTKTNDSLDFDPVSVVLVSDHVSLSGGTGGASLSEFGVALDRCILCVADGSHSPSSQVPVGVKRTAPQQGSVSLETRISGVYPFDSVSAPHIAPSERAPLPLIVEDAPAFRYGGPPAEMPWMGCCSRRPATRLCGR